LPSLSLLFAAGCSSSAGPGASPSGAGNSKMLEGKVWQFDEIISTKMAGPADLMRQENAYLAALPKTARYSIEGDELWLRDSTGAARAHYVAR